MIPATQDHSEVAVIGRPTGRPHGDGRSSGIEGPDRGPDEPCVTPSGEPCPATPSRPVDLAVLGAGPAGASAAVAAAEAGLSVLLVDEARSAGGQIHRETPGSLLPDRRDDGEADPDRRTGDALRRDLEESGAATAFGWRVWSVVRLERGFRLDAIGGDAPHTVEAAALLVATGAIERILPFPGWTTPGVFGLAAATILLKSQRVSPGRRVVVAGAGPLLAAVAAGVLKARARVAAVVDLNGPAQWLAAAPSLALRPRLAARGAGWTLRLLTARVPVHFCAKVVRALGGERLEAVEVATLGRGDGRPSRKTPVRIGADALCVGHGLAPATEVPRLLRAECVFDRALGGWRPNADRLGRTSVPGLYVAGDGAGVLGGQAALLAGRTAGAAIAADLRGAAPAVRASWSGWRARRFGAAMTRLTATKTAVAAEVPAETIVCRCEDVTRAEIDAACDAGARDVNQLKHFTRCGMGPCQGRSCGEAAAELLALRLVATGAAPDIDAGRRRAGQWTGRVPLRPVPLSALVGEFSYADIPVPEPAPL